MADRSASGSRVRRAAWAIDALEEARLHASLRVRLFGDAGGLLVAGRYAVRDRIGSGGGGTVHRAHDRELDRDVALKLLAVALHRAVRRRRRVAGRSGDLAARRRPTLRRRGGAARDDVATVRNNLGNALAQLGRVEEAEAELRAVLALRERVLGRDHASAATTRTSLARVLVEQGRAAEAVPLLETSLEVQRATATPADHLAETERELERARVRRARSRTPASP